MRLFVIRSPDAISKVASYTLAMLFHPSAPGRHVRDKIRFTAGGGPSSERYRRTSRGTPSFVIATGVMSPCSSKRISSMQTTRWLRSVSPRGLL